MSTQKSLSLIALLCTAEKSSGDTIFHIETSENFLLMKRSEAASKEAITPTGEIFLPFPTSHAEKAALIASASTEAATACLVFGSIFVVSSSCIGAFLSFRVD